MLRLSEREDNDEYGEAVQIMANAMVTAKASGLTTNWSLAAVALEALGQDFDVSPVDPGPDENEIDEMVNRMVEADLAAMADPDYNIPF